MYLSSRKTITVQLGYRVELIKISMDIVSQIYLGRGDAVHGVAAAEVRLPAFADGHVLGSPCLKVGMSLMRPE